MHRCQLLHLCNRKLSCRTISLRRSARCAARRTPCRERRSPDRQKVAAISRSHLSADGTAHGTAANFCTSATINYRVAREFNGVPRDVLHAARRASATGRNTHGAVAKIRDPRRWRERRNRCTGAAKKNAGRSAARRHCLLRAPQGFLLRITRSMN